MLRRFFERARIRSSGDTNKKVCLCTTAKRDSFYDDLPKVRNKSVERLSVEQYGFTRSDKPKRLVRHIKMEESDFDDDTNIKDRLRHASSQSPANIPMLVVVSFNPDIEGLKKQQIEIQRGFPVNAQFLLNEWLFIKTADNEEGFVPYVCCRPILKRSSIKISNDMESSYRPYDFEANRSHNSRKSPSTSAPTITPPRNKKFSLSSTLGSHSFLFQNSFSCKRRQDLTSSSCGGDSGFSDCESSSQNPNQQSLDLSNQRYPRLSNIRTLRSLSNSSNQHSVHSQNISINQSIKTSQYSTSISKFNDSSRVKSQLSISSNSAFTQFVKKNTDRNQQQENNYRQLYRSNNRLFHREQDLSSSISNLRCAYSSYDETKKFLTSSSKCSSTGGVSSTVSSPYIRRTPFARRSLPHHIQPIIKKTLRPVLSSSPDPFKSKTKKEQQLRRVVLAEPSLSTSIAQLKPQIERHFSDLSLNQIENDSLLPPKSTLVVQNLALTSCSSSNSSSASSDDDVVVVDDDDDDENCSNAFVHIQINNKRCPPLKREDCILLDYTTTTTNIPNNNTNNNANTTATKSSSFIHNVSITV